MHRHRARAPAVRDRGGCGRYRARPRCRGLPRSALPHRDGQVVLAVDANDLDVRPFGKARMVLDVRTEPANVTRVVAYDRVRVADRDRNELDVVDRLRLADL